MTDKQFLKRMISLTEKMCNIYDVEPLDQEARQAILDEVHEISAMFNRSRRNFFVLDQMDHPRFVRYLIWFLLGVLGSIVLYLSC